MLSNPELALEWLLAAGYDGERGKRRLDLALTKFPASVAGDELIPLRISFDKGLLSRFII